MFEWLFRRRREDDLQQEIHAHLAMAEHDLADSGMDREAARLAAMKQFGNVTLTREATRLAWGERWRETVRDFLQDVRYSLRVLRGSPGYALTVIGVLTLGIGANIAIFSYFKGVVLKPVRGVEGAVGLAVMGNRTATGRITSLSHPDFRDIQSQHRGFRQLAGTTDVFVNIGVDGVNHRAMGELVTGNYFQMLGIRAQLGRTLLPSDDERPGAHPVAVVSDGVWKRIFGSDPDIVGRRVTINGHPMTIVGVTEPTFQGTVVSQIMGLWVPFMMQPQVWPPDRLADRGSAMVVGIGRLHDGITIAAADAEARVVSSRLAEQQQADRASDRATVVPIWRSPFGAQTYILPVIIPVGVMGLVLLMIVCANVGNLVLARGLVRRGEIAARLALGASRGRILRLLTIESIVLAVPAAVAALVVTRQLMLALSEMTAGAQQGFWLDVETDGWVIGSALLLVGGTTVIVGLIPAWRATRLELAAVMKDDLSPRAAGRARLRGALVVAQVAMSMALLVGAVLTVRSLDAARQADPGFEPGNVSLLELDVSAGYDPVRGQVFLESMLDRVRAEPGVESASLASRLPLRVVEGGSSQLAVEGYEPRRDEDLRTHINRIGSDYFTTLRVPVLAGRDFVKADDASGAAVAIVNGTTASRFWGSAAAALGKRIRIDGGEWKEVVGVVSDLKYFRLNEAPRPYVYVPFGQSFWAVTTLHVRASNGNVPIARRVHDLVVAMDPSLPPMEAQPMAERTTDMAVGTYEFFASILGTFGVIALLLAAFGTYGLVSYAARNSSHEIGIRMAIGADRGDVIRRFLASGLRLGVWGAGAGVLIALGLTRVLSRLLYGVTSTDAIAFGAAPAAVLLIVLVASFAPAWRASRTDPIAALRHR